MPKLITDVVLKKNIENILTELVNSTFDWQEYTDSEISDILEITDEQAMELTKIINDQIIANNKLWSSSKTDTEIKNALIESNKYADELIGQISSISLEYVTTLPSSDIKSNVIYILQGSPNTLNVYNESTSSFVSVGDLDLDLTGYYTKTEVDNLLADKSDDNTVLHADDVVQDLTTTSGTTVLSTTGLQTELDKKFDKSGILSAISATTSDEKVLSEKATKTELDKKVDLSKIKVIPVTNKGISLNDFRSNDGTTLVGSGTAWKNSTTDVPSVVSGAYVVIWFPYSETANYGIQILKTVQADGGRYKVFSRSVDDGNWSDWKQFLDEDEITTTINSTSTDAQVPTAKAVNDKFSKYVHIDGENMLLQCTYQGAVFTDFIDEKCISDFRAYHVVWNSLVSGIPCGDGYGTIYTYNASLHKKVIAYDVGGNAVWEITQTGGVWGAWQQIRSSVADVPWTTIAPTSALLRGNIRYRVKNGVCYVKMDDIISTTMSTSGQTIVTGLPKPEPNIDDMWYSLGSNVDSTLAPIQNLLVRLNNDGTIINYHGTNDTAYFGSFTYPVAES